MKRKRAAKKANNKGKVNNPVELNDAALALVSINTDDTPCVNQNDGSQRDSKMDTGPSVIGVDKPSNILSTVSDKKDISSDKAGSASIVVKLNSILSAHHHQNYSKIQTRSSREKSNQQAALALNNTAVEKETRICLDSPELQNDVSEMIPKKAGSTNVNSSNGVGISSEGAQDKNLNRLNGPSQMLGEKIVNLSLPKNLQNIEMRQPFRDARYNEKELSAALAVIKKIMKMDAAKPFNIPVDPVALDLPDYFDIIDTPMDFGTICHDLEHDYKYMNSEDVFKDVRIIWENCSKYNNKGDSILDLMRRVKKNFMKYWKAVGLYADTNNRELRETSGGLAVVKDKKKKAAKKKTLQDLDRIVPTNNAPSLSSIGGSSPSSLRPDIDALVVDITSKINRHTDIPCMGRPNDPPGVTIASTPNITYMGTSEDPPVVSMASNPDIPCMSRPEDPLTAIASTSRTPIVPLLNGSSSAHAADSTSPSGSSTLFVLSPQAKRAYRPSRWKNRQSVDPSTPAGVSHIPDSWSPTAPDDSRALMACRRGRGPANPSSCRPKEGEEPFTLIWVNGAPVGDHAHHFGRYCGEEGKIYLKYPLHLGWDTEQTAHVYSFYYSAQQRDYKFVGEEDPNNEGQRLPFDEVKAKLWVKDAIQHSKREWRNTMKFEYYKHWVNADDITREAILASLPSRFPKEMWPLLCSYFERPDKQAEANRNASNRKSTKRPTARSTQGSISLANANYRMKKELREDYDPAKAWVRTHQASDPQTVEYRKKFEEAVDALSLTPDSDPSVLAPVLDAISGGHHGGYERGLGRGYRRRLLIDSSMSTPLQSHSGDLNAREIEMKKQMEQQQQQIKEQQEQMQLTRKEMEEQRRLIDKLQRRLDRQQAPALTVPSGPPAQPGGFDLAMFLSAMTTACMNMSAMCQTAHPPAGDSSSSDSNR